MSYEVENSVVNDVLCYLTTSRKTLSQQLIVNNTVAFYNEKAIKESKELIFKICKETSIKRKVCVSHPNPLFVDVEDILNLLIKADQKKFLLPNFLAEHYASLPPGSGFECIAAILCSLREEISNLREEQVLQREANNKHLKAFDEFNALRQDVSDIKISMINPGSVHELRNVQQEAITYAAALNTNSVNSGASISRSADLGDSNEEHGHANMTGNGSEVAPSTRVTHGGNRDLTRRGENASQRQGITTGDRSRRPNRNIAGTREAAAGTLSGASRVVEVFVGGCNKECDVDELQTFCTENNVNLLACITLNSKSIRYNSFKITVNYDDVIKVLKADFWPKGIFVRKFFNRRN